MTNSTDIAARYIVADVMDGLAAIPDGTVDLVVTSPPFFRLRSYLEADHPRKHLEIGQEPTAGEFVGTLLAVTAEIRRVLAPHGSIAVELGDSYGGSGGAGGDYNTNGMRAGQNRFAGTARADRDTTASVPVNPLAKSMALIPDAYRFALAYGIDPFTGAESPAGRWLIRNVVTWVRPNPPVGALGDKWRPATSDMVIATTSPNRYWDDIATRKPYGDDDTPRIDPVGKKQSRRTTAGGDFGRAGKPKHPNPAGRPLLDWWQITEAGYPEAHHAVFPRALVEPVIAAMCPRRVCLTCGEPSRRIVTDANETGGRYAAKYDGTRTAGTGDRGGSNFHTAAKHTAGWTDCGHDTWRTGHVLDPFAGSGTTGEVATGYGRAATLIDLDERNAELARKRIGPFLFDLVEPTPSNQ